MHGSPAQVVPSAFGVPTHAPILHSSDSVHSLLSSHTEPSGSAIPVHVPPLHTPALEHSLCVEQGWFCCDASGTQPPASHSWQAGHCIGTHVPSLHVSQSPHCTGAHW